MVSGILWIPDIQTFMLTKVHCCIFLTIYIKFHTASDWLV